MSSISEQSIVYALKQLEFKKYDVEREDFIETLAKDMNSILFPTTTTTTEEQPKKKGRKPKTTTAAPAPAPAPAAEEEQKPARKKPGPKPKAKAEGEEPKKTKTKTTETIKLNTVLVNRAKAIAGEAFDKKKLTEYLNGLGKEVYDSKPFEDHVKEFYTKKEETVDLKMEEREYEGKTYYVDPETRRVYEKQNGVPTPIGYVGMGKFEGLKML